MKPLKKTPAGPKTLTITFIKHFIDTFFTATKHEKANFAVTLICLTILFYF